MLADQAAKSGLDVHLDAHGDYNEGAENTDPEPSSPGGRMPGAARPRHFLQTRFSLRLLE